MDLPEIIGMYVLGTLPSDAVPTAAADALAAGYDSPTLRQLASADPHDRYEIERLLKKTLAELGIQMPAPPDAALSFAKRIAAKIVSGAISPYDGAKQIWGKAYTHFPQLTELRPFVGMASEYELDKQHRVQYSQDIIDESKKLLAS
jgi:hypothetical protein